MKVPRGVAIVVFRSGKLLVIRRSQFVIAPGWCCFPGGGVEAGETEEQTVVREFQEELGCAAIPLRLLWRSTTNRGVALSWWLAELAEDAILSPNLAEVAECFWLSPDELCNLENLLASNQAFLQAWREGVFELE